MAEVLTPKRRIETREVRDLTIIGVPEPWWIIDNDDQIKARVELEVNNLLTMGPPVVVAINGEARERPRTLGLLRNWEVTLVRPGDDVQIHIDHPDCQPCVEAVAHTATAAREGFLTGIVAIVQFTYDEIVNVTDA